MAFPVEDADKLAAAFGLASLSKSAAIVIWTTTPWTIPANQALNVHPEFNYALVDTGARLLVLAEELVESCLSRYGLEGQVIVITGASSGFGRYCVTFSIAGLAPIERASYVNSSPSMYSSQLASGKPPISGKTFSSSAGLDTLYVSAQPAPAVTGASA